MFLVCFGLYTHVLNVSMRFKVRFCIYEHIQNFVFATFFGNVFVRNDGDATPGFCILKLLLQPWDLSHRVKRQKLMVESQEEMSVRVWKGCFMASLLLHWNFSPNVLSEPL